MANIFYLLRQKTQHDYNQAKKDETAAADDVRIKRKQMTPPNITGRLSACAPYDRKGKRWMEITDVITWWKNKAVSSWLKSLIQDRKYFSVLLYDSMLQLLKGYRVKFTL